MKPLELPTIAAARETPAPVRATEGEAPNSVPPLFEIRELFHHGEIFRLTIAELTVAEGERLGIVGPNGSGKTTLLRILAALDRPAECGRLRCRGENLRAGRERPSGLAFLRQHPYLFRGSVAQNLSYPLRLRRVPRNEADARVAAMLLTLDLASRRQARVGTLSGGEQQRLALGRVLLAEPRILLLDEPTAHLDRHSQGIIERVLAAHPATLIFTTHDVRLAHRLATRLLHLRNGAVTDTLPENVLTGMVRGDRFTTAAGLELFLGETFPEGLLKISLDPRHLVLSTVALASSMRNQLRGRVRSVQDHGSAIWLEIDCGETLTVIITRDSYDRLRINLGRELFVSFKAQAVEVL